MNAEHVLKTLFDILWTNYKQRVPYAAHYERMVVERGGSVQNDHVAFRTFNASVGGQPPGVDAIARVFEALGYRRKERYLFVDKKLTAWHWEHATNAKNPKLFISQLEVNQLSPPVSQAIIESVADCPDPISAADLKVLKSLENGDASGSAEAVTFARRLAKNFVRPWAPPQRQRVEFINKESQYAAWTLLHGNEVNHFTAYINEQNVSTWPDIEATVAALREAGVPMKDEFEGDAGSKLRQSSTHAVDELCPVREDDGSVGEIMWSYAYYELAERGLVPGTDGRPVRFQAFLGDQATNLFDMTKRATT